MMKDGYPITLSLGTSGLVCEIEVTPPAIEGGVIPQDCMRSGTTAISWPKSRKKYLPLTVMASWDPDVYGQNLGVVGGTAAIINLNQSMTLTFPGGRVLSFWATITKFEPAAMKEGERPTATVTIELTNMNSLGNVQLPSFA